MINDTLIIVSMTSWTKRIGNCVAVINSLIDQTIMPDHIELNLSVSEFNNKEKDLPSDLMDLIERNDVISINWIDRNDGVFKKIIPTIQKYYGQTYYLLSVDDDWIYRNDYIELMVNYLEKYNTDTFCLANAKVIGNRQIYRSSCFKDDFWKCLTQEVIDTRIDDSYIERYLECHGKTFSSYRPYDTPDITRKYNNLIFPNSHNTVTGQYDPVEVKNAQKIINRIKFNEQ